MSKIPSRTYRGHVENGAVVLDEPIDAPEGAVVSVSVVTEEALAALQTLHDRLKAFHGKATGLPRDIAGNHDHYLHGQPKR